MNKLMLNGLLLFCSTVVYPQQKMLLFKKGNKSIDRFWPGAVIAFQLKDKQWQKGQVTKISSDSLYILPTVVHYNQMNTDTVYYNVLGVAFSDVFAMPKNGVLIDYINGRFQISTSGGHVHWYWIKSGWIFRVGALGYAILNLANGLIKKDFAFKGNKPGITAGVFLLGLFLKQSYKPVLRLGKKYHLETWTFQIKVNASPGAIAIPGKTLRGRREPAMYGSSIFGFSA